MLQHTLANFCCRPRRLVQPDTGIPVPFDQPFNPHEKIRPDRLRAGIATPHPTRDTGHHKQDQGRQNQQAGYEIDFLRPDFDEEKIKPLGGKIDQNRLIW